ncbi:Major Facilitator Superfamily protein [Actinomyces denticolens]|uniref:Major Facilitator Superfamily protein n=1 Tax=Actinomyces denticolens TaxID=52767 RepID=A0ABY1ICV8_9ACTO|nr:MFS transporter [Actinomyces denticolens]SHI98535.1 Major Facilitator Superfamily protein [Actinomyces denticolens]
MRLLGLLVLGSFITSLGTGMTAFGLAIMAYAINGSASAVAAVQMCALAPLILLAPMAGAVADRVDRRLVMVIGDGGSVLGLLVILAALRSDRPGLALVLAGVTLSSIMASLTEPALRASVSELVEPPQYVRASGLLQASSAAKLLMAPALAGLLLPIIGLTGIILIDASTCVLTVACSLAVRRALPPRADAVPEPARERLLGGWHQIRYDPRLRTLVIIMTALTTTIGIVQVLFKPSLLPWMSAQSVGLVETLCATGLLIGATLATATRARPATLLTGGTAVTGAAMIAMAARPWPWSIAVAGIIVFAALALCQAGADALVRGRLDPGREAAAWGAISLITQSGYLLAYATAAPLADCLFSPLLRAGALSGIGRATVGSGPGRGAALTIAVAGALTIALAALLRIERARLAPEAVPAAPTDSPKEGAVCSADS